jgi:hypothetical protein
VYAIVASRKPYEMGMAYPMGPAQVAKKLELASDVADGAMPGIARISTRVSPGPARSASCRMASALGPMSMAPSTEPVASVDRLSSAVRWKWARTPKKQKSESPAHRR